MRLRLPKPLYGRRRTRQGRPGSVKQELVFSQIILIGEPVPKLIDCALNVPGTAGGAVLEQLLVFSYFTCPYGQFEAPAAKTAWEFALRALFAFAVRFSLISVIAHIIVFSVINLLVG
jgi:hypothetical protein